MRAPAGRGAMVLNLGDGQVLCLIGRPQDVVDTLQRLGVQPPPGPQRFDISSEASGGRGGVDCYAGDTCEDVLRSQVAPAEPQSFAADGPLASAAQAMASPVGGPAHEAISNALVYSAIFAKDEEEPSEVENDVDSLFHEFGGDDWLADKYTDKGGGEDSNPSADDTGAAEGDDDIVKNEVNELGVDQQDCFSDSASEDVQSRPCPEASSVASGASTRAPFQAFLSPPRSHASHSADPPQDAAGPTSWADATHFDEDEELDQLVVVGTQASVGFADHNYQEEDDYTPAKHKNPKSKEKEEGEHFSRRKNRRCEP